MFRDPGTVTAGNSSGICDGAAALVVMAEETARSRGIRPLARIAGWASAGVDPHVMGWGVVPATRKLLAKLGWALPEIDVVEVNEAFAAQVLACDRDLKFDWERTNLNGGAIALGHPIGMTGARLAGTVVHQLQQRGARRGLATLCISGGQGMAVALERVDTDARPAPPPTGARRPVTHPSRPSRRPAPCDPTTVAGGGCACRTGGRPRPDQPGPAGDAVTGVANRYAAALAWTLWLLMPAGFVVVAWLDGLLRQAGRPDLVSLGSDAVPYLLAMVSAGTVGAVVASRRPRHPVGWLLLATALSVIVLGFCDAYAAYGLLVRPGSLPGAAWRRSTWTRAGSCCRPCSGSCCCSPPPGRCRRTGAGGPGWSAGAVVGLLLNSEPLDPPYQAVAQPLLVEDGPLAVVAILASAISSSACWSRPGRWWCRFRRARGVERLQLGGWRWRPPWSAWRRRSSWSPGRPSGARRSRCGNG